MVDVRRKPRPAIIKKDIALIPLGVGAKHGYAIVDSDMAWLADRYKWTVDTRKKYALTGTYEVDGKRVGNVFLHRVIVGLDAGGIVDHISRDSLDNRRANLRIVDNRINQLNTETRGGTSQYRGVCWDKRRNAWRAAVKSNQVTYNLGYYNNEVDAAIAYNIAAIKHFGEHARLNDV